MADFHLFDAGAQDDDRPDQRHDHRRQTAWWQTFTQKQRSAQRDINRRKIIHRRHLGDGDPRHGKEPQDHRQRVDSPPRPKEFFLPACQMGRQNGPDHREQEHQTQYITQKRGLSGGHVIADVFDHGRDGHKHQAGKNHPEDANYGAGLCLGCHALSVAPERTKGKRAKTAG